ncbi:MAG: NADH-quinone oxidoreductase subunit N [Acidimicrobiia bacterium]|nr:NADH-quinone oxidoreductase subunit N [Acidimicrobiia bacterium]MDH3469915.1 NADH-quinone oxidoreductase subunit N [Acidimicrobiia bacterium]
MSFLGVAVELWLVAGALVVLLADITWRPPLRVLGIIAGLSLAGAVTASVAQWRQAVVDGTASLEFSDMIAVDGFSAFGGLLIVVITGLGLAASWDLVEQLRDRAAEFIVLTLLAAAGVHVMAAAANFIVLFIGLEIASISLYILAGYTREREDADEAALKYFLLGAFASAVFIYGVSLIFASTGTTSLYGVSDYLVSVVVLRPAVLFVGAALVIVGLGFKVSAAPFHMWAPDVYQGAPSGIAGYMTAAAKVGGFAALGRVLAVPLSTYITDWAPIIAAIAAASVVLGTVLAIAQTDIKRMLAYSSVAHAGFILTAMVAGGDGLDAMWFYLATYSLQVIGAFAIVATVGGAGEGRSPLTDFTGLGSRSPLLAATLATFMLAMGGIPLTAGFAGKVAVFQAAIDAGYLWLAIVGVLAATAGLFFYLRVIVLMYMQAPAMAEAPGAAISSPQASLPTQGVLAVTGAITIGFGIVPWPLLDIVADALPF